MLNLALGIMLEVLMMRVMLLIMLRQNKSFLTRT